MTIRTAGRPTPLIGALAVSLLAFTACGGGGDDDASESEKEETSAAAPAEAAEAPVDAFPVGEPFGDAVWSVDVGEGEATVTVRPDRIVVDRSHLDVTRAIQVYTPEGEEAWTHDLSEHQYPENIPVEVLETTVAFLVDRESEGSGLDKAQTVTVLTLLSLADGSVVAEVELPDGGAVFNDHGGVVFHADDGVGFVTEEGEIVEVEADVFSLQSAGLVHGAPFWVGRDYGLNTEAGAIAVPGIDQSDIFGMDVLAVDRGQGLLAVRVSHGVSVEVAYYAVEVATGQVAYEFDCADFWHTEGETNVARSSPSGEYTVHESIWLSADGGQCFGGGEQRTVEFRAVDDAGTAYGVVEGEGGASDDLVAVPAGGEPVVSALPDGAPVPSGVVSGGIAVHLSGTVLTGNPIL